MEIHAALRDLLAYVYESRYRINSNRKYNFMFESFMAQKRITLRKLPDIQQSIEVVEFLRRRYDDGSTIKTHFPLTENLHAKADIPPSERVCLWLGANVMLEYSIEEAEKLLETSNENAIRTIAKLDGDMALLRDQITTTEVNMARVHNHMVKIKAQLRALETAQESVIVTE